MVRNAVEGVREGGAAPKGLIVNKLINKHLKFMKDEVLFSIPFFIEELQGFAKANFGKKLTKAQLTNIKKYWSDHAPTSGYRMDILYTLIETALDPQN